ncbi:hypothetical protein CEXT_727721 [Caerostris extrusa]|uniref:Uncharacterized protein n=1 Tax=Caerostris extrusa TaxID=172846 RepID=A0AAV4RAT1_CAEEX|nr:hypothetical protein CEXT_727721 [Caerostris extrusa]
MKALCSSSVTKVTDVLFLRMGITMMWLMRRKVESDHRRTSREEKEPNQKLKSRSKIKDKKAMDEKKYG